MEIAYRLRRLGIKQIDIARELGVSPSAVAAVIHGKKTAYAVAASVAGKLSTSPEDLWPNRYCFRPRGPSPQRNKLNGDEKQPIETHYPSLCKTSVADSKPSPSVEWPLDSSN